MTREETMMSTDSQQQEKIKTPFAKVIVDGRGANPYFSILYFDPADKDFHIGYSSYDLDYVFNWLDEEFEIIENGNFALAALRFPTREMVERMRGRWVNLEGEEVKVDKYGCPVGFASCSVCDDYLTASEEYSCQGRFCPNCGAPMTGEAVDMMLKRMEEMTNEH